MKEIVIKIKDLILSRVFIFSFGFLFGVVSFYYILKNYAPIESGTANCYTDGEYRLRLQAELNFPDSEKTTYYGLGHDFYMLSFNKWRPCNPAEFRTYKTQPTFEWRFPGVSEEKAFRIQTK